MNIKPFIWVTLSKSLFRPILFSVTKICASESLKHFLIIPIGYLLNKSKRFFKKMAIHIFLMAGTIGEPDYRVFFVVVFE